MTSTGNAKKALSVIMTLIMLISLFITSEAMSFDAQAASTAGFYVSGTSLCDANGNAFMMRGVNIAHAWFPSDTQASIKAAANLGANTVRIVLSDGAVYNKTSSSEISNIIEWCKSNKLVCILEVHDATGSDSTSDLNKAVDFWKDIKDLMNNNRQYVLLNIANEWYGTWDGSAWANGCKNAVKALRNAGIKNTIIVDCAGWGQYPDSIRDYGKDVFNADSEKNTMFSIHMYEYAGGTSTIVKNNIDNALSIGVPVIIGEFGCYHTNGDVDEMTIMSYCKSKGVGYLGWSWIGNGSDWYYLDLVKDRDGKTLTDWGNTLFNSTNGIKNTSKTCTVYTSSSSSSSSSSNSSGSSNSGTNSDGGVLGLDGIYYIKNVNSGKYLDLANGSANNGTNIQQYEFNGSHAQQFKLVSDGEGYYSILTGSSSYKSGLDVEGAKKSNNANILQYTNRGSDNQKFQLVKIGNAYAIKTKISDCYSALDVYGASKSNGANVSQYTYKGSNNQLWYLEKCDGSTNSNTGSTGSSSGNNSQNSASYISAFWGKASCGAWDQAVNIDTAKNGGSFDTSNIKSNSYFYVEYSGSKNEIELILQSWSGGAEWAKVQSFENGSANGHYYAKFSYNDMVRAFGSNFGKLDRIIVGAKTGNITVYSVCVDYS